MIKDLKTQNEVLINRINIIKTVSFNYQFINEFKIINKNDSEKELLKNNIHNNMNKINEQELIIDLLSKNNKLYNNSITS